MKQAQISAGGSEKTQRCVETVQKPRMKSTKMHYKRQGSAELGDLSQKCIKRSGVKIGILVAKPLVPCEKMNRNDQIC